MTITSPTASLTASLPRDIAAGMVVFLIALPLCMGIALASNAPLFAGLVAGIVGGILVGLLSGSHTSVSGPAAGLTAIVAAQIASLGSFQALQLALVIAGLLQISLGVVRAGFLAAYFPSSVIKGLLSAIGIILILKQIPHILGHHMDPVGDLAFEQHDRKNTFSELMQIFGDLHIGAAVVGVVSVAVLVFWERSERLKRTIIPAPLIVVVLGIVASQLFQRFAGDWHIRPNYLVNVPIAQSVSGFLAFFQSPDFSQWSNPAVYSAALTVAAVASLETLLNLEAVDKLDPQQRVSPPSRELLAQGVGNTVSGLLGGLPITSVVVRSSANINAGARSKYSAILHGVLILVSVALLPNWLNAIPLSCLAAILLVTGAKLVSPRLVRQMWNKGRAQFIPFASTVVAIVLTDLLIGILIGMAIALGFVLVSSIRRPLRSVTEKHLRGDVIHIELADQISFLNRGSLVRALDALLRGSHVLLDARRTDYIDPDLLSMIHDFKNHIAPARGIEVSLLGFRDRYQLWDRTQYIVHSTRELQAQLSADQVLQVLKDGHARFRSGQRLTRDLGRQMADTSVGQYPLAVVLSCIDSRTPAEIIFDLGVGDIFSVRIAGNITSRKVLGSIEYGCAVAGARLVLVLGHTGCGAVKAAVDRLRFGEVIACEHLGFILEEIQQSIGDRSGSPVEPMTDVDVVARRNVLRSVQRLISESHTLEMLNRSGSIAVAGAIYNIANGDIEFLRAGDH